MLLYSGTPSARVQSKSHKRRNNDDSDGESHKNEEDSDEQDINSEDDEEMAKPKKKVRLILMFYVYLQKKRPTKHLTDSVARKKRAEERKKTEKGGKEMPESDHDTKEKKEPSPVPTPEPAVKIPSVSKYSPLQLMCDHLLRKIQAKDPEEFFAFPVTLSMAPDYHNIITKPMDFSQMRQKIEDDAYEAIPQMKVDAELIVSNALTYNNPNTVCPLPLPAILLFRSITWQPPASPRSPDITSLSSTSASFSIPSLLPTRFVSSYVPTSSSRFPWRRPV